MYPVLVRQCDESTVTIGLTGDIDCVSCDEIESIIQAATLLWSRVVVDMSGVSFCGSTGLGVFIRGEHLASEREGQLVLTNVSTQLRRIVELAGLEYLLGAKTPWRVSGWTRR
jgi:anti-anti-sigma factor